MNYIILLVGLALLVKGADFFVAGSANIARIFKIPPIIIGLTIVAMGTSAPEAAVSVTAALAGQNDIALANVLGSNIFNTLVVVGVCSMIRPMRVETSMIKKEIPFSILATIFLFVMSFDVLFLSGDNILSKSDGIILLLIFTMFIYSLIMFAMSNKSEDTSSEQILPMGKSIFFAIFGLIGIILGGKMVVDSASFIASTFGISQNLIGLTIVAIGTSLPELVTSIVAAKKGESGIALGNAIGSNIFNILLVLGLSSAISPISVGNLSFMDISVLFVSSIIVYIFAFSKKSINKIEGLIMILSYIAYMVYAIIR